MSGSCCHLLLSAVILVGAPAFAEETWDHEETVEYRTNHDPSIVALVDGRELTYAGGTLTWAEMDRWPEGKDLLLVYGDDVGIALVDPASRKYLFIVGGLEKYPIDRLLEECLNTQSSTLGMAQCNQAATGRWDRELNLAYQRLMGSLEKEAAQAQRAAQREWIEFRDSQTQAIGAIYRGPGSGSLAGVGATHQVMELTRSQALRLLGFLGKF